MSNACKNVSHAEKCVTLEKVGNVHLATRVKIGEKDHN